MIKIEITAQSAKELTEKLQELAAGLLAELPEAPKEEPKKKASKKKTEPVEEQKTEEPAEEEEEEEPKQEEAAEEIEEVEAETEEIPTVEDLRRVITELSKADPKFKQKAKDLMTKENYTNLSGIPEDKRAEFMAKLEKLGAK